MPTLPSCTALLQLFRVTLAVCLLVAAAPAAANEEQAASYRTPRAGEGFTAEAFGREVQVEPRNRRSWSAWDLSLAGYRPEPDGQDLMPVGVITIWDHRPEGALFRAQVSGFYNDIFWSSPLTPGSKTEAAVVFENLTVPVPRAELVDGRSIDQEELLWGYVRPGFGIGVRKNIAPGHEDNMAALDLLLEPGFLYFRKGSDTDPRFVVPRDTALIRAHLQMRMDALERNVLELPHAGVAAGFDLVLGHRFSWNAWGMEGAEAASRGRNYVSWTGYALAAGAVPGVESDRHRLIGVMHAGTGHHLDRFSAPRIGGGPNAMGEEYGISADPVLPGATMQEFFPRHYAMATIEYRWEPVFFAYIGINGTVARLDRLRDTPAGFVPRTDTFRAVGARVTSGFLFRTRLQLAYSYNFDVVRNGSYGGHEMVVSLARSF